MIRHTEAIDVGVPAAGFLPWFVPRDPVGLFDGWGPIPGVAGVEGQSGAWTAPGSRRLLRLSDGAAAVEAVLAYDPPARFAYRMSGFSGLMGRLVRRIDGEWRCAALDARTARIAWTYAFADRGFVAGLVLRAMVATAWRGYMRAALARVRAAAEAEIAAPCGTAIRADPDRTLERGDRPWTRMPP